MSFYFRCKPLPYSRSVEASHSSQLIYSLNHQQRMSLPVVTRERDGKHPCKSQNTPPEPKPGLNGATGAASRDCVILGEKLADSPRTSSRTHALSPACGGISRAVAVRCRERRVAILFLLASPRFRVPHPCVH